jgi:hypothetical protein
MATDSESILQVFITIKALSFSDVLRRLFEAKGKSVSDFREYLAKNKFHISAAYLNSFFNGHRHPSPRQGKGRVFIHHAAEYLALSSNEEEGLFDAWRLQGLGFLKQPKTSARIRKTKTVTH